MFLIILYIALSYQFSHGLSIKIKKKKIRKNEIDSLYISRIYEARSNWTMITIPLIIQQRAIAIKVNTIERKWNSKFAELILGGLNFVIIIRNLSSILGQFIDYNDALKYSRVP